MEDIAESVLLERCTNGDRTAEAVLCQRYTDFVANVCVSFLVDREKSLDVAHDVFERFVLQLRAGKIDRPAGWLRKEVSFRCLDKLRKEKRYREVVQQADVLGLFGNGDAEAEQKEMEKYLFRKAIFWKFLSSHSLRDQYIFIALYYHGYSYPDLSKLIGLPVKELYEVTNNIRRNFKYFLKRGKGKKGLSTENP